MNIVLTPDLTEYVQEKVQAGTYRSASEAVRAILRQQKAQDENARQERILALMAEWQTEDPAYDTEAYAVISQAIAANPMKLRDLQVG